MWISFHLFINDPVHKCALPIKLIICCLSIWLIVTRQKVTDDRKGAAAPAKQQRQRRSAPCTVSPHTEACFVVGCSPSFSSLVSSVGVGTGAKNAQIVWFQIRGQHCNFSVTVIVTLTPTLISQPTFCFLGGSASFHHIKFMETNVRSFSVIIDYIMSQQEIKLAHIHMTTFSRFTRKAQRYCAHCVIGTRALIPWLTWWASSNVNTKQTQAS